MKKLICLLLTVLIFSSFSLCAAAQGSDKPGLEKIIYSEYGTYTLKSDGTKAIKGLVKNQEKSNSKIISQGSFPEKFDRRDISSAPMAQQWGTCWAYAAMSGLEAGAIALGEENPAFSEAHLAYFTLNPQREGYNIGGSRNCYTNGANQYFATYSLANLQGIANRQDFPMPANSSDKFSESDRFNRGSGYVIDEAVELTSKNQIKDRLMNDGEVFINFYTKSGYYAYNSDYGAVMFYNSVQNSNHAVSIIGWDDTVPASAFTGRERPAGNGAWIAKHTDSSGGYYIYISYEQFLNGSTGFKVRKNTWQNHYTYSSNGYNANYGTDSSFTEGASIYKAQADEKISAVSFIVDTGDEIVDGAVNVTVYKNLSGTSSPVSSEKISFASMTIDHDGYYTFDLPEQVSVSKDELFSVCVAIKTSYGVAVKQCVEYDESQSEYYVTDGYSFYRDSQSESFSALNGIEEGVHDAFMHIYTVSSCEESENIAKLYVDGKLWKSVEYNEGQKSIGIDVPQKAGYEGKWESYSLAGGEVTINAVYTPIEYTAAFVADGVTVKEVKFTVEAQSITPPAVPEKTGYTAKWSDYEIVANDITINAVYTPGYIKIVNFVKERTVNYKTTITLRSEYSSLEGLTAGWIWECGGNTYTHTGQALKLEGLKSDVTVYAVLKDTDSNVYIKSEIETIKVKNGFFDKIVSFFARLFKSNDYTITQ